MSQNDAKHFSSPKYCQTFTFIIIYLKSRVTSGCSLLLEVERSYLDSYVFLTNYNREASCGDKQPNYFGGEINN